MINFQFPSDESVHEYLGKQYFAKDELTPEEYQESKKITFRQMYNGVEDQYKHIPFFKEVADLIETLEDEYQGTGQIMLPNGRIFRQSGFTAQKLFNYYIQCLETVNNVKKLTKLKELFQGKKSKVVLVVYDSILVDYSADDPKGFLTQIKEVLEEDGFIVKGQKGPNYDFYAQN